VRSSFDHQMLALLGDQRDCSGLQPLPRVNVKAKQAARRNIRRRVREAVQDRKESETPVLALCSWFKRECYIRQPSNGEVFLTQEAEEEHLIEPYHRMYHQAIREEGLIAVLRRDDKTEILYLCAAVWNPEKAESVASEYAGAPR
jgi:hypothetical protein